MTNINKLINTYNRLIQLDHHKDRDYHWYITPKWSYGEAPVWKVQHYGYCYKEVDWTCETYEDALTVLEKHLKLAIASEVEWAERVLLSPDEVEEHGYRAKRILEIYNENQTN